MKIYGSTQYVGDELEYYQLDVINQWDWSTKPIAFKELGNGILISYCLRLVKKISENCRNTELVIDLTDEMKNELIEMGYTLNK